MIVKNRKEYRMMKRLGNEVGLILLGRKTTPIETLYYFKDPDSEGVEGMVRTEAKE